MTRRHLLAVQILGSIDVSEAASISQMKARALLDSLQILAIRQITKGSRIQISPLKSAFLGRLNLISLLVISCQQKPEYANSHHF